MKEKQNWLDIVFDFPFILADYDYDYDYEPHLVLWPLYFIYSLDIFVLLVTGKSEMSKKSETHNVSNLYIISPVEKEKYCRQFYSFMVGERLFFCISI